MSRGVFAHWPNRITALRFVGALALFAVFGAWCDRPTEELANIKSVLVVAFWLFIATAASDFLDGYLARRGNLITAFGRIADPFVDKVLILGSMIYLAVLPWSRHYFPAWIVVVILAREFLVTGIRGYVESLGGQFPADWFGKVKMFTQCFAVGTVLGLAAFELTPEARGVWTAAAEVFVMATVVTSVGSGLSYVIKARAVFAESSR
ncbi:MAG: CDP-diacylglycerol--glycerol-3-phosphate 3-phosphatidyltransferase [Planctomycetes bacterium]|nr:CDP-diacylglycerol--glycerol-3-phosphate 3-phosphatidyltransferase [Planctomycetota bacterium]